MLSLSLVESFRAHLATVGLELADLRIGGTQHRPLVQVRIEWPDASRRVTVDDCATASRALEAWLRAGGPRHRRRAAPAWRSSAPRVPAGVAPCAGGRLPRGEPGPRGVARRGRPAGAP